MLPRIFLVQVSQLFSLQKKNNVFFITLFCKSFLFRIPQFPLDSTEFHYFTPISSIVENFAAHQFSLCQPHSPIITLFYLKEHHQGFCPNICAITLIPLSMLPSFSILGRKADCFLRYFVSTSSHDLGSKVAQKG